jgi:FkbM family methyltransferase
MSMPVVFIGGSNMLISYAQNFEDIMLARALGGVEHGYYIDIGAAWPDFDSVTKFFYDKGWSGINIEPNPRIFETLQKNRKKDKNICTAVGDCPGVMPMYFFDETGLSTLVEAIAENNIEMGFSSFRSEISVVTLNEIWKKFVPKGQEVHFLKIDVEGFEKSVIASNDWLQNRPWIVIVEATLPLSQIESYSVWEEMLLRARYDFVYADGLNRFYISSEHAELKNSFIYPPNIFDNFKSAAQVNAEENLALASSNERELRLKVIQLLNEHEIREKQRDEEMRAKKKSLELEIFSIKKQLDLVFNSWSWRITKPFRILMGKLFGALGDSKAFANGLIYRSINLCRSPLYYLIDRIFKSQQISAKISSWLLGKYPALHAQLAVTFLEKKSLLTRCEGVVLNSNSANVEVDIVFREQLLRFEKIVEQAFSDVVKYNADNKK